MNPFFPAVRPIPPAFVGHDVARDVARGPEDVDSLESLIINRKAHSGAVDESRIGQISDKLLCDSEGMTSLRSVFPTSAGRHQRWGANRRSAAQNGVFVLPPLF